MVSAPEFEGTPMTKREVCIARLGYVRACAMFQNGWKDAERAAAKVFPLPKVTRPRVVQDPAVASFAWSMSEHGLLIHDGTRRVERYPRSGEGIEASKARIALWADLLAHPTEEVEDDA